MNETKNKTVDVLAVQYLEELAGDYAHLPRTQADILAKAAGIAELIERERVMRAALEQAVTSMQDSGYSKDHIAVRAARAALRACGSTPSYPTPSQSVGNAASVEGGA